MNELQSITAGIERSFPCNIEAECALLGSIILDNDVLLTSLEQLSPESFYKEAHKAVFGACIQLYNKNSPIDLVTLTEELTSQGKLDAVGGAAYISSLINSVATTLNVSQYITIIWEKHLLRRLLELSQYVASQCMDPMCDVNEVLDGSEKRIFDITESKSSPEVVSFKDLIKDSIETVEHLYNNRHLTSGITTHFKDVDELISGLHPADMIVVAARPSMGKTSFVLNIIENVAVLEKLPVAFFSLEMSKEQLALRMLCSHARVNSQKVRRGFLGERDFPDLVNAAGKLASAPIYIDDTPNMSVLEMRAKARRLKKQYDIQLLAVDYLQLMQPPTRRVENRQQEITQISRSLKSLARELNIPIIVISQLNRAVENRADHRPLLSDLRESGAIEQDADLVMMLLRRDYYDPEDSPGIADLYVAKHRNGPVGEIRLRFFEEYTLFANYTEREDDL